jgi:EAL domain-containing protein (putative c-di-GMP-specific phosphodiesterase class I)
MTNGGPAVTTLLQPIVSVDTGTLVAAEALGRLADGNAPVAWLAAARHSGDEDAVEAALLRSAFAARDRLPAGVLLTVNLAPTALCGPQVATVLARTELQDVVIELLQEHAWPDQPTLFEAVQQLRRRGARIAVDDAGTGFQGLLTITLLKPDWVKLDRSIVTGAHHDEIRRASLAMFAASARRAGSVLVAEGVEHPDDFLALRDLGVELAQGYLIGVPTSGIPTGTTLR